MSCSISESLSELFGESPSSSPLGNASSSGSNLVIGDGCGDEDEPADLAASETEPDRLV